MANSLPWNRPSCDWPLVWRNGRTRREFVGCLSPAAAVLFRDDFRQFLSLVDQIARLIRRMWRKQEAGVTDPGYSGRDKIDNYLLAGAGIIFIIFSLIKTKLPHYTLPAFPLLSLLLARRWIDNEMPIAFFKRSGVTFAIVCVSDCAMHRPFRHAILSGLATLSRIAREFTARDAVRCGRLQGAEFGLVFSSLERSGFAGDAGATSQKRPVVHGANRSAICYFANRTCAARFFPSCLTIGRIFAHAVSTSSKESESRSHADLEARLMRPRLSFKLYASEVGRIDQCDAHRAHATIQCSV